MARLLNGRNGRTLPLGPAGQHSNACVRTKRIAACENYRNRYVKFFIFWMALAIGIPCMAMAASYSLRLRGLLVAALIFSTVMGDVASINFISMENYRGPDRGFEITLTDLIAAALVLALVVRFPRRVQWLPYNSLWLFVLFALAIVSTVQAPEPLFASFTLLKFTRAYLLYWCVVNCLRTDVSRDYIWLSLMAIAAVLTVLTLQQKYIWGLYRIHGPFDHSNTIPLYANLILPLLFMWGLIDKHTGKFRAAITVLAVLGLTFTVVATQSRAGLFLAGMCVMGVLCVANLRLRSARVGIASAVVFLAMALGGAMAADTIIKRIREAPESSAAARDEFNIAARKMAGENLFGVGLNNFSDVLTRTPRYREHITVMQSEEHAGVAHHIYWLTAAEMGYPALVVFVIIIVRFMWLSGHTAWRCKSLQGLMLAAILIGFTALHAQGFLEWALRVTPVTYMLAVVCGLCVAFAQPGQRR